MTLHFNLKCYACAEQMRTDGTLLRVRGRERLQGPFISGSVPSICTSLLFTQVFVSRRVVPPEDRHVIWLQHIVETDRIFGVPSRHRVTC